MRIVDTIGESGCGESCKAVLAVPPIAPGAFQMLGATEPGFHFTATAKEFDHYFPACLANGFFTIATPLRGTDATATHIVGLMNYTPADVAWLAAIPRWEETNYLDGGSWLNKSSVTTQTFFGWRQTLGMKSLFAPHTSALRDLTPGANDMTQPCYRQWPRNSEMRTRLISSCVSASEAFLKHRSPRSDGTSQTLPQGSDAVSSAIRPRGVAFLCVKKEGS